MGNALYPIKSTKPINSYYSKSIVLVTTNTRGYVLPARESKVNGLIPCLIRKKSA